MNIDAKPWTVPNFISLDLPGGEHENGMTSAPTISIKHVDSDTLARMCDEFRAEVFKKSGKADPALEA